MYFLDVNFCENLAPVMRVVTTVFKLLQWGIPIILILFGAIDLGKAVIASKEDEMKKAQGTLIKRVVYAVIIFFLFTIVGLVMSVVGDSGTGADTQTWSDCWAQYY